MDSCTPASCNHSGAAWVKTCFFNLINPNTESQHRELVDTPMTSALAPVPAILGLINEPEASSRHLTEHRPQILLTLRRPPTRSLRQHSGLDRDAVFTYLTNSPRGNLLAPALLGFHHHFPDSVICYLRNLESSNGKRLSLTCRQSGNYVYGFYRISTMGLM